MRTDYKQWHKSSDKQLCGVLAGLAQWQGWDIKVVRLIFIILTICSTGTPFVVGYIILAIILPNESEVRESSKSIYEENRELKDKFSKLKAKVEKMENDLFDKEKAWDEKFEK